LIKIDKFRYKLGDELIQLQVDYYNSDRTNNLYIDNVDNDVDYYVYFYTANKSIFVYDAKDIAQKFDCVINRKDLTEIKTIKIKELQLNNKKPNKKITLEDFY